MYLPQTIKEYTKDKQYIINDVGMTKSHILMFDDMVLKIEEMHEESNNEYKMLKWLQGKLPVPKIICFVQEDNTNYLLMSKIDGYMAFEPEIMNDPVHMIELLVKGIKLMWNVDISDCPTISTIDYKLRQAKYRIDHNLIENDQLDLSLFDTGRFKDVTDLYNYLENNKPQEQLIFSHGDYCLPNVLFKNSDVQGFIDLGRSGVADIYQDVALCLRSMKYNLGENHKKEYEQLFIDLLGIAYDTIKIDYYILLDELF